MNKSLFTILLLLASLKLSSQTKTIHVFVALCDNQYQGIVPVPKKLGNGKDLRNNLYWGALYGVKSYFKYKAKDWILKKRLSTNNKAILERVIFKHKTKDVILVADAYDGEKIKTCTENFLKATNHQNPETINLNTKSYKIGGNADIVCYIGHDGLMDFDVNINYQHHNTQPRKKVIILACFSKAYFSEELKAANANPILLTTNLMAPEAYTLEAALNALIQNKSKTTIKEQAAQAYHKYQKCGIKGARKLFSNTFIN